METTRSRDGTTLAFDRSGDGPPVIVVGGATCDRAMTRPLAEMRRITTPRTATGPRAINVACCEDVTEAELAAALVIHEDGKRDRQDRVTGRNEVNER